MKANTRIRNAAVVVVLLFGAGAAFSSAIAEENAATPAKAEPAAEEGGVLARIGEAPWRLRLIPYGWVPDISFDVKAGGFKESFDISPKELIQDLGGVIEFSSQVRKGPLGVYLDALVVALDLGHERILGGRAELKLRDNAALLSYGLLYQLGPWRLGESASAPTVTVEPYLGGRTLIDIIKTNVNPGPRRDVRIEFTTPYVGLETVWDFTERWNLRLLGSYGGFNVNGVDRIWELRGLLGYRFDIGSLPANVMLGWRRIDFEYTKKNVKLDLTATGPVIGLSLEF